MTTDDQSLARLFVRDLVTATIKHGIPPGSSGMKAWVESAMKYKIINDLSLVYPEGDPGAPNLVFPQGADLWLPRQHTVVSWRSTPVKEISHHRAFGMPNERDLELFPSMREVSGSADTFFVVHIPCDSNRIQDIWVSAMYSDATEEDLRARSALVRDLTHLTITRQSSRARQRDLGPSDLSDPCDLCVARKIASVCGLPVQSQSRGFSLKAWIGTAIHQKLERDMTRVYPRGDRSDPNFYQEVTATIGEVPGLGIVRGHIDLLLPRRALVVDYKTADLYRIDKYRKRGVPSSHAGQTMLYLRGVRNSGRAARMAALVYIPRDSDKISDIWIASCSYQDHMATGLLNRAQNLVEVVRSGQTSGLVSDPDCFVCHVQHRIRH